MNKLLYFNMLLVFLFVFQCVIIRDYQNVYIYREEIFNTLNEKYCNLLFGFDDFNSSSDKKILLP